MCLIISHRSSVFYIFVFVLRLVYCKYRESYSRLADRKKAKLENAITAIFDRSVIQVRQWQQWQWQQGMPDVDNRLAESLAQDCHKFVQQIKLWSFAASPKGLEATKFEFNLLQMKLLHPKNIKFVQYKRLCKL